MAISADAVWEIRTTGAQTNGGFFVTGASGSDFSQQDAAQYALTGVTTAASDAILLTASAAADMVGNGAYIVSGTNFTTGWYEVISVVVGVSITLDRTCTTAAGSNGVVNIGGAFKIGGTLDDDVFEAGTAGNKYWVKSGTYTLGESTSIAKAGTATARIVIEGYDVTRGDKPTGTNRPYWNNGAFGFAITGGYWSIYNIRSRTTGTGAALSAANTSYVENCQLIHAGTATNTAAAASAYSVYVNTEFAGFRSRCLAPTGNNGMLLIGCVLRDSDIAHNTAFAGSLMRAVGCLYFNFVTAIARQTLAYTFLNQHILSNCTLYGAENKLGIAVDNQAGQGYWFLLNNIFYGFTTALSNTDASETNHLYHNTFYNNTTDVSGGFTKHATDIALNPSFADVTQLTGSTATISGTTITQSGATFQTSGVVAGDVIYVKSGTGSTNRLYEIVSVDSETQLTLDTTVGTSAVTDKVWQITLARDFRPGLNMKGAGFPGAMQGGFATGYMDIGAVQRQEDYPAVGDVKNGTSYADGDYTGTGANISSGLQHAIIGSGIGNNKLIGG